MSDLEKLLRDRQDVLRGRPRDCRDDLNDWIGRQDWEDRAVRVALFIGILLSFIPMIVIGWMFMFGG